MSVMVYLGYVWNPGLSNLEGRVREGMEGRREGYRRIK